MNHPEAIIQAAIRKVSRRIKDLLLFGMERRRRRKRNEDCQGDHHGIETWCCGP